MSEPANQTIRDMIERRSCRSFKSDMVPHETVEKIIERRERQGHAVAHNCCRY